MVKILFSSLCLLGSCTWLEQHPQIESDLEKMGSDAVQDGSKVILDVVDPSPAAVSVPAAPN